MNFLKTHWYILVFYPFENTKTQLQLYFHQCYAHSKQDYKSTYLPIQCCWTFANTKKSELDQKCRNRKYGK